MPSIGERTAITNHHIPGTPDSRSSKATACLNARASTGISGSTSQLLPPGRSRFLLSVIFSSDARSRERLYGRSLQTQRLGSRFLRLHRLRRGVEVGGQRSSLCLLLLLEAARDHAARRETVGRHAV